MRHGCEPTVWITLLCAALVLLTVGPEMPGSRGSHLGAAVLFGAAAAFALARGPRRDSKIDEATAPGERNGAAGSMRKLARLDAVIARSRPPAEALRPQGPAPPDIGALEELRACGSMGPYRYTPVPIRLEAGDAEDDLPLAA